ncbi:MAG: deoxyribose-phosphate aldolase [Rikenellaceae bacterium]
MKYTKSEVARLIDISAVKTESSIADVNEVLDAAKANNLICVFSMPCFVDYVVEQMKEYDTISVGGVVGFPSGAETVETKLFQAQQMKDKGCNEVDMVMNIGKLKSGMYEDIVSEISAIKSVVAPLPLKVIIEVPLLTNEEIVKASQLVLEGGADFVKTGTGWSGSTTLEHVKLIKDTVGDAIKLKVAGGVRDLETLKAMHQMGVCRFGIGYKSVLSIIDSCDE